mgnify:CR=1 FL=1
MGHRLFFNTVQRAMLDSAHKNASQKLAQHGFEIPPFAYAWSKDGINERNNTLLVATAQSIDYAAGRASCIAVYDPWWAATSKMQIKSLVHEMLHLYDDEIVDIAYDFESTYQNLSLAQQLRNADSLTNIIVSYDVE